MIWQYIIIGIIIAAATAITIVRMIRFFTIPESKCNSCAMKSRDCAVRELKLKSEVRSQKSEIF